MQPPPATKPLRWVASSLDELRDFPRTVQRTVGVALRAAQLGRKHDSSKPLKGFKGAGVLEIVEDHDGDAYRAVYTVRFPGKVYVLHVFQKKSKRGVQTPKHVMDVVKTRLKAAARDHEEGRREG